HHGHALAAEVTLVRGAVDFFPDPGEVRGDVAVATADHLRGMRGSHHAGVADPGFRAFRLQGDGEISGRAVVPFSEGGGDYEQARGWSHDGCGVVLVREDRCVDGLFRFSFTPIWRVSGKRWS